MRKTFHCRITCKGLTMIPVFFSSLQLTSFLQMYTQIKLKVLNLPLQGAVQVFYYLLQCRMEMIYTHC